MEEHGVSKLVSVKFSGKTDDSSKSSESVAKALGKSENLASEEAAAIAQAAENIQQEMLEEDVANSEKTSSLV
jgi:hypothetical protein